MISKRVSRRLFAATCLLGLAGCLDVKGATDAFVQELGTWRQFIDRQHEKFFRLSEPMLKNLAEEAATKHADTLGKKIADGIGEVSEEFKTSLITYLDRLKRAYAEDIARTLREYEAVAERSGSWSEVMPDILKSVAVMEVAEAIILKHPTVLALNTLSDGSISVNEPLIKVGGFGFKPGGREVSLSLEIEDISGGYRLLIPQPSDLSRSDIAKIVNDAQITIFPRKIKWQPGDRRMIIRVPGDGNRSIELTIAPFIPKTELVDFDIPPLPAAGFIVAQELGGREGKNGSDWHNIFGGRDPEITIDASFRIRDGKLERMVCFAATDHDDQSATYNGARVWEQVAEEVVVKQAARGYELVEMVSPVVMHEGSTWTMAQIKYVDRSVEDDPFPNINGIVESVVSRGDRNGGDLGVHTGFKMSFRHVQLRFREKTVNTR